MRPSVCLYTTSLWCMVLLVMAEPVFSQRVLSPQGKVDISFEPPDRVSIPDPDKARPTAGLKSIHYKLNFYKPGSNTIVSTTDFYDIQASPEQTFPTPSATILKGMLWSPQEDFVVLPKEAWPPEQKKARKAVSLTTDYVWLTTDFTLEDSPLVWIDRSTVVGNFRDDCRVAVAQFDARKGKMRILAEASLPAGYSILSSTDNSVLLKKILGPCATPDNSKFFVPECSIYDLRFNRREISACPP